MKKGSIINNKKGFTLVELLAVIVVLAIIMVIAVPTVLKNMNNARIKSFQLEGQRIIGLAQQYYESEKLLGTPSLGTYTNGSVKEACYNFSDFNLSPTGYTGFVVVNYSVAGNATEYKIYLTNEIYSYVGATEQEVAAGQKLLNTTDAVTSVKNAKCVRTS